MPAAGNDHTAEVCSVYRVSGMLCMHAKWYFQLTCVTAIYLGGLLCYIYSSILQLVVWTAVSL